MSPSTEAPPVAHLILDLGGVVLPSAMPQVIADLATHSAKSDQQLRRYFNTDLCAPFWSGRMGLEEFWSAFTAYAGVPGGAGRWQTEMTNPMLPPLDHIATVRRWAGVVPVGVLSNQRAEWVLPVLARAGLLGVLDPLLISSLTGLVKPDPRAFAQLTRLGPPPERVLYVDDRPPALRAAERFGMTTLEAYGGQAWIDTVSARLGLPPEGRGRSGAVRRDVGRMTAPAPRGPSSAYPLTR